MIKKGVIKNSVPKPVNPNKILVENFVALQKVMTNLSIKFDNLSDQISKLLNLFEVSARALAEKEFNLEKGDKSTKRVIEKLDNLLEQNKIIARGITLMHENSDGVTAPPAQRFPPQNMKPQFPREIPRQINPREDNEFQESISSKTRNDRQNF